MSCLWLANAKTGAPSDYDDLCPCWPVVRGKGVERGVGFPAVVRLADGNTVPSPKRIDYPPGSVTSSIAAAPAAGILRTNLFSMGAA